ncbi:hypothetical protein HanPSC8_Chr07g0289131 [Helianthus annuus]|nr:hypothetical protein HanPSC8_Chr07g0289131 [Helianthus annuus]
MVPLRGSLLMTIRDYQTTPKCFHIFPLGQAFIVSIIYLMELAFIGKVIGIQAKIFHQRLLAHKAMGCGIKPLVALSGHISAT